MNIYVLVPRTATEDEVINELVFFWGADHRDESLIKKCATSKKEIEDYLDFEINQMPNIAERCAQARGWSNHYQPQAFDHLEIRALVLNTEKPA